MGKETKESTNAIAVQLDAQGKVIYDMLAQQGHSEDKVYYFFNISSRVVIRKELQTIFTIGLCDTIYLGR